MALSDYTVEIIFYAVLFLVVYLNRKKFDIQAKIIMLYKTRFGLKLMDRIAEKYRGLVKIYGYSGVGFGFLGMPLAIYLLVFTAWKMIESRMPYDGSPIVIPGVPLAGIGIKFPLLIGWISLFIIMIVHEFSHGVVARAFMVKVKSSGIAFFGPILGAFVEPDEKELERSSDIAQYSIYSAGPFSNILLFVLISLISSFVLFPIFMSATSPLGVQADIIPNESAAFAGMSGTVVITQVNHTRTEDYTDFVSQISGLRAGDPLILSTQSMDYNLTLGQYPDNASRGYMGLTSFKNKRVPLMKNIWGDISYSVLSWLDELFYWTSLISLAVAIMNVLPIFITDGARILKTAMLNIYADKKKAMKRWYLINQICLAILFALLLIPAYFSFTSFFG